MTKLLALNLAVADSWHIVFIGNPDITASKSCWTAFLLSLNVIGVHINEFHILQSCAEIKGWD